jgi:hypothetical protein
MLDDCSRFQTGGGLYARETHAAYLHFLESAFRTPRHAAADLRGPCLRLFTAAQDSVTRLQENLLFYGVTFIYAPTPQRRGSSSASTRSGSPASPRFSR